jgi:hypothetical protein
MGMHPAIMESKVDFLVGVSPRGCKQKSACMKAGRRTCGYLPHDIPVQSVNLHFVDFMHCSINCDRMSPGFPGRGAPTNENSTVRLLLLTCRFQKSLDSVSTYFVCTQKWKFILLYNNKRLIFSTLSNEPQTFK